MSSRTARRSGVLGSIGRLLQAGAPSAPLDELVNSLEFEEQAGHVLGEEAYQSIAGSDRSVFDRFTFRPRMNVPTLDMDLSVDFLGQSLFTPLVVGPVSQQGRYHPDGELATIAGAADARTVTIVSHHASVPLSELALAAESAAMPFWVSVYADAEGEKNAEAAVSAGARAVFVTLNVSHDATLRKAVPSSESEDLQWQRIDALRNSLDVPIVVKGVLTESEARRARDIGVDGVVVSGFGGLLGGSGTAPLFELRAIRDALPGELPILVDGSFRRATDFLVALILGARGILLARPVMWALASYGADGVTTMLQMLQRDLARCFAMVGASNVAALTPKHLTIHSR